MTVSEIRSVPATSAGHARDNAVGNSSLSERINEYVSNSQFRGCMAIFCCISSILIGGGATWYIGQDMKNDTAETAGKVVVIGTAISVGFVAFVAGFFIYALSPHNGQPGAGH